MHIAKPESPPWPIFLVMVEFCGGSVCRFEPSGTKFCTPCLLLFFSPLCDRCQISGTPIPTRTHGSYVSYHCQTQKRNRRFLFNPKHLSVLSTQGFPCPGSCLDICGVSSSFLPPLLFSKVADRIPEPRQLSGRLIHLFCFWFFPRLAEVTTMRKSHFEQSGVRAFGVCLQSSSNVSVRQEEKSVNSLRRSLVKRGSRNCSVWEWYRK